MRTYLRAVKNNVMLTSFFCFKVGLPAKESYRNPSMYSD